MTTDIATLGLALDSRQIERGRQALANLRTEAPAVETATNRMQAAWTRSQAAAGRMQSAVFSLRGALAALGVGLSVRAIASYSDAWTRANNQLGVAGLKGTELTGVMDALFQSAQRNAAPLDALINLYSRAAMVQRELNVSSADMLLFTDRVAQALRVSGQSAQQSSGALLQLAQALGSGTVRAEELNSVLEGALPIAQAAARGLTEAGGSVARLRQLVIEGKVSSAAFFNAFMSGSRDFAGATARMEITVEQGFTKIGNATTKLIGEIARVSTASATVGDGLGSISEGIERLAANEDSIQRLVTLMERLAGAYAGMKIGGVAGPWGALIGAGHGAILPEWRNVLGLTAANSGPPPPSLAFGDFTMPGSRPAPPVSLSNFPTKPGGGLVTGNDQLGRAREGLELARAENEILQAKIAGNASLSRHLEVELDLRRSISDELRVTAPEVAAGIEAEIRKRAELEDQLQRYQDQIAKIGEFTQSVASNMEQAFSDFVETGKVSFKELVDSILKDLARVAFRQALTGLMGSLLGGLGAMMFPAARGLALSEGQIVPFARGGLLSAHPGGGDVGQNKQSWKLA